MTTAHDFSHLAIDGAERPLSEYAGKALLVVNVASKCGFTRQYTGLEALYRAMTERGLVVLGFPCNQFGGQEPGTEEEIQAFCSTTYDVTFPLFSKLDVNGEGRHPLYAWLTAQDTTPKAAGDVQWNFEKFVLDRQGHVVARFGTKTPPESEELREAIEKALA